MLKLTLTFIILVLACRINGYSQWVLERTAEKSFVNVSVVDSGTVWAIGFNAGIYDNYISRRLPNGVWDSVSTNGILHELTGVAAKDVQNAWVTDAVSGLYGGDAHIYRTTNGGLNWILQVTAGGDSSLFQSIQFSKINPAFGYAICDPPDGLGSPIKVYKTTDYGVSWNAFSFLPEPNYAGSRNSMCVTDSNHVWFGLHNLNGLGDTLRVLLTTDGCQTFSVTKIPVLSYDLSAICFRYDNSYGIAASIEQYNYYYRSFNGGFGWSYYYTNTNLGEALRIMWIPNTSVWYAVTSQPTQDSLGPAYKSTDNGYSWYSMSFPSYFLISLTHVDAIVVGNKVYAYAVSSYNSVTGGRIYRLIDTVTLIGVKNISSEIPKSFTLYQNYPNPFNPVTKIKFEIPTPLTPPEGGKAGLVSLNIYDVLGREVAILVNEQLKPGTYEVEFDGTKYSSGIYFYKIICNEFVETKKMLLIK